MENELHEIALHAQKHQKVQTLMHYVNKRSLIEEHKQQKNGKASGVDTVTKETYEEKLEENIDKLIAKMKTFSYKPQAVKRVYIPKAGSDSLRPLGIPAYEDKLVQGVMRRVLDQIYEDKFYEFSYGFRENKGCHQAIAEVNRIIMTKKIDYIVDADIKGFFDNVNHEWLMKFLENDIADKNFLRYIKRFLISGIIEDTKYYESDKGTPQGGLISPVLANVYLHYVLDMWFDVVVKKQCKGEAYIIRYADDFICLFEYKEDAEKFYKSLEERLLKFDLEMAKDKSKIIPFGRNSGTGKSESFDFLGFTHSNGKTRQGNYCVVHRTSKRKLMVKKQSVKEWLKENMHNRTAETIIKLNRKLKGHYAYYGISGNYKSLLKFYNFVITALYKSQIRRSQRTNLTTKKFYEMLEKYPIVKPKLYVNIWQHVRYV